MRQFEEHAMCFWVRLKDGGKKFPMTSTHIYNSMHMRKVVRTNHLLGDNSREFNHGLVKNRCYSGVPF